jgi:hypothetical protein
VEVRKKEHARGEKRKEGRLTRILLIHYMLPFSPGFWPNPSLQVVLLSYTPSLVGELVWQSNCLYTLDQAHCGQWTRTQLLCLGSTVVGWATVDGPFSSDASSAELMSWTVAVTWWWMTCALHADKAQAPDVSHS